MEKEVLKFLGKGGLLVRMILTESESILCLGVQFAFIPWGSQSCGAHILSTVNCSLHNGECLVLKFVPRKGLAYLLFIL